jgi:glycosyltransferase involved in cell wall biosynthesis
MVNEPFVSVLLPVCNGGPYLREAIDSILSQSYPRFELIIINDGSTDDSWHTIETVQDPRVRAFQQMNLGIAGTLNRAIQLARGVYLARQDADDVALPKRFERQVEFLETHQDYGLVGTWATVLSERTEEVKVHNHPSENHVLKYELLFDNPFVHSSMMIRKAVVDRVGGYVAESRTRPAEDYELWSRVAREFDVANIPEVLQIYRDTPKSLSKGVGNPLLDHVINTSISNLTWVTGRATNDPAIHDLAAFSHGAYHRALGNVDLRELEDVLNEAANKLSKTCNVPADALRDRVQVHLHTVQYHYDHYNRYCRGGRIRRKIVQLAGAVKQNILFRQNRTTREH